MIAGRPGFQPDGSFLTPEGERLTTDVQKAAYLRTLQDWVVRPQLRSVEGVAGIDSIGGYEKQLVVQPDPSRMAAYGVSFSELAEALERANISVAQVVSPDHIILRTWERGAGLTEACGTAACAALVNGARTRRTGRKAMVTVPGGDLVVEWLDNDHVTLTGPAEFEWRGMLDPATGAWTRSEAA